MLSRSAAKKCILPGVVALAVAVCIAPAAFARIMSNTIDTSAKVHDKGRWVLLTGPIECTHTQWVNMRITVTQRSTGAVAQGYAAFVGTVQEKTWKVFAPTTSQNSFEEGPATAVAIATSKAKGKNDDAHQWLVEVTLEE